MASGGTNANREVALFIQHHGVQRTHACTRLPTMAQVLALETGPWGQRTRPLQELELGPNGGLVYCMDYLEKNLDWLQEKLAPYEKGGYTGLGGADPQPQQQGLASSQACM